ncbi:hypothetical protein BTA51_03740 [Hahella sp. CCB-MM4]|nr:hypothetical protein BTA51_03740 [Hahella sp. CCB-MM4]
MRHIAILFICISLAACANTVQDDSFKVTDVQAAGTDNDQVEFCSNFQLDSQKAQEFFNRSQQVSPRQLHDEYSYLPCYVRGIGKKSNQECQWEIRAGGTGETRCGSEVLLYGCEECEGILN